VTVAYASTMVFLNAKRNVGSMLGLSPLEAEKWLDRVTKSNLQYCVPGLGLKTTEEGLRILESIGGGPHAYALIKAYDIQMKDNER